MKRNIVPFPYQDFTSKEKIIVSLESNKPFLLYQAGDSYRTVSLKLTYSLLQKPTNSGLITIGVSELPLPHEYKDVFIKCMKCNGPLTLQYHTEHIDKPGYDLTHQEICMNCCIEYRYYLNIESKL